MFYVCFITRNGNPDDNLTNYPYVVGIGYVEKGKEIYTCTGTLIEVNWVVTAGDCIVKERRYFIAITRNDYGNVTVIKNKKIIDRHLKDHFDYHLDHSTFIGLLKIEPFASKNIMTFPKIISSNLRQFDMRFVYIEYVAGFEDKSKNNKLKVVRFVSTGCIRGYAPTIYICVLDKKGVLSMNYGGPLIYNGTILVGVYAADVVEENVKRFIAIKPFHGWIKERIGK